MSEKMREQFEAWAKPLNVSYPLDEDNTGLYTYKNIRTQSAFVGFKAALSQASSGTMQEQAIGYVTPDFKEIMKLRGCTLMSSEVSDLHKLPVYTESALNAAVSDVVEKAIQTIKNYTDKSDGIEASASFLEDEIRTLIKSLSTTADEKGGAL